MHYHPRFARRDGEQFLVKLTMTPSYRERRNGTRTQTSRFRGRIGGVWYSPAFIPACSEVSGVLDAAVYSFLLTESGRC